MLKIDKALIREVDPYNDDVRELLIRARKRIANKRNFTSEGFAVPIERKMRLGVNQCEWAYCAAGAILAQGSTIGWWADMVGVRQQALKRLAQAMYGVDQLHPLSMVMAWSDSHSHKDVLKAFDRAILSCMEGVQ